MAAQQYSIERKVPTIPASVVRVVAVDRQGRPEFVRQDKRDAWALAGGLPSSPIYTSEELMIEFGTLEAMRVAADSIDIPARLQAMIEHDTNLVTTSGISVDRGLMLADLHARIIQLRAEIMGEGVPIFGFNYPMADE